MSSDETPLVSVIVPFHDAEPFISAALESIVSQDHRPLELLLIDDGSNDESAAAAAAVDLGDVSVEHLRSTRAQGPAGARNAGLERCTGSFVTYLDADDLMTERCVTVFLEHLGANPGTDIVIGQDEIFLNQPTDELPSTLSHRAVGHRQPHTMSMMHRRAVLDVVGGFDESFNTGEDTDWLVRAKTSGCVVDLIDFLATRRRIHGGNLSYGVRPDTTMRSVAAVARRRREGRDNFIPFRNER